MNLISLASHTVDLEAIPDKPVVLDVGCRGFDFSREILQHRPGARIFAMDPDPAMPADAPEGVVFLRVALVGDGRQVSTYADYSTGEGNFLCDKVPPYARAHTVQCTSILALMGRFGIAYWDVIKLDCEESEFQILENWPGPIAGQLSVEFHDWTGTWKQKCTPEYYRRLFAGPLKDYEVLSHELSTVGPGPAWGHWDSVFRLRNYANPTR